MQSFKSMTMPTMSEPTALEDSIRMILSGDHQSLEESFNTIVTESACNEPIDLRESWQTFEHKLLAHFDAEEAHILPVFGRSEPKEAREILDEHERLRGRLVELAIDLDLHCLKPESVRSFVEELRSHAAREELLLYPWAARHLGNVVGAHLRRALSVGTLHDATGRVAREEWRIDPDRSTLHFSLRHLVVGEIKGEFARWGGTLSVDEATPTDSSVRVWVDLESVNTGEPSRDGQIRSPEFFEVGRFPRAVFASRQIRLPDRGNPVVRGRLQMHGTEGDVELEIVRRDEKTGADGTVRAVYSVKGQIDRRQFGLRWNQDLDVGGVVVGDQVQIEAHLEAIRSHSENAPGKDQP